MPYCELITTNKTEAYDTMSLSHELAKIIEKIPGKEERWVMTHIEGGAKMAFAGCDEKPVALISLKSFGELGAEQYDMLTREFCTMAERLLAVPADRVYVTYEPVMHWGWNGSNF